MTQTAFAQASGQPFKTLEEWALLGLQNDARRRLALPGRAAEFKRLAGKELVIPTALPTDIGEGLMNAAALWGILGTDAKDDKYTSNWGPVGIMQMMVGGMRDEGRVADIKSFLPWALYKTQNDDQERILCEALKHPETIEILKPVLPGIFYSMVFPSAGFQGQPEPRTSTGFIRTVHAAAKYPELHEMLDEYVPEALARELAWCPQNFASMALGRYQASGDYTPIYPLVHQMLEKYGQSLSELVNPNCINLIKQLQQSGDKPMKDALRRFAGTVFDRPDHFDFLDATQCMLVVVGADHGVDIMTRDENHRMAAVRVMKGELYVSLESDLAGGYTEALKLLKGMESLTFRNISDPARTAGKTLRREINTDPALYARMDAEYKAQNRPIQAPWAHRHP